jgi:purine-binding chemotaxis protein CheW
LTIDAETWSPSGIWATFRLAGELFAVPVEHVQEVMMPQPLTPVPLAPAHMVGLINLRGHIVPAVDLRARMQVPSDPAMLAGGVVVIRTGGELVGLLVDAIGDVLTLPAASWRATPDTLNARHRVFVFGICPLAGQIVLGLRVDTLSGDVDVADGESRGALHG